MIPPVEEARVGENPGLNGEDVIIRYAITMHISAMYQTKLILLPAL